MSGTILQPANTNDTARWQDAEELRWAARHWAVHIGVKTPQVHLRPMTTKWASISTNGRLTLNTETSEIDAVGELLGGEGLDKGCYHTSTYKLECARS
jgi:hypothetical protein